MDNHSVLGTPPLVSWPGQGRPAASNECALLPAAMDEPCQALERYE